MIRTSELHGMSVIEIDAATKLGEIDEIFLDLDRRMITGLSVSQGGTLLTGDEHTIIPADAVHSIGEDAVMVRGATATTDSAGMELMTRASSLAGHNIVTESGTHLGAIDDVLFDEESGRIVGYAFAERRDAAGPDLGKLFGLARDRDGDDTMVDYVRADANVRFGGDLIVAPDDAVVRDQDIRDLSYDPVSHTSTSPTFHTLTGTQVVEPAGPSVVRPANATQALPVEPTVASPASPSSRATARTWRSVNANWGQGK